METRKTPFLNFLDLFRTSMGANTDHGKRAQPADMTPTTTMYSF